MTLVSHSASQFGQMLSDIPRHANRGKSPFVPATAQNGPCSIRWRQYCLGCGTKPADGRMASRHTAGNRFRQPLYNGKNKKGAACAISINASQRSFAQFAAFRAIPMRLKPRYPSAGAVRFS